MLGRAPAIRRSILTALLCFPTHLAGPACSPGPSCCYLTGDGVRAGVWADMPCPGHVVAGQPHPGLVSPPQIEVTTCALGIFLLGARVHIPRLPGPLSIYQLADPDHLKAAAAFSSGFLQWL